MWLKKLYSIITLIIYPIHYKNIPVPRSTLREKGRKNKKDRLRIKGFTREKWIEILIRIAIIITRKYIVFARTGWCSVCQLITFNTPLQCKFAEIPFDGKSRLGKVVFAGSWRANFANLLQLGRKCLTCTSPLSYEILVFIIRSSE